MSTIDNTIKFPTMNIVRSNPLTVEDVENQMLFVKQCHIHRCMDTIMPLFFENMALAGFNLMDETISNKEIALLAESVRSVLYSFYSMKHPFQQLSDKIFIENEGTGFELTKQLSLDFDEELPKFVEREEVEV